MLLELQHHALLIGQRPAGFTHHYYTEWDDGLGKEKISLFLVVSVASTQVPGSDLGSQAFQMLQDHFLADLTGDPYDRFEAALKEINHMVNEKEKELDLKFVPNMHVICGVIQKDMLFLSQRGEAHGYLVRKRHVSSVTEGLYDAKNKNDLFQNIASGVLEVEDVVMLSTGPLVKYVTPNDLSKILSEQSLSEAMAELKDLLSEDVEEQMSLMSFDILEKIEEVQMTQSSLDVEEEPVLDEASDKEKNRWAKGLKIIRDWSLASERWAFLSRFRRMDRKQMLSAIVAMVVVLVGGLLILNLATGKQRTMEDLEGKLAVAEENVTQAETRGSFDKAEAALLLDEAEAMVVEVLDSGYLGGQASTLLDRVQEQRDFLDNVVRIDDELSLLVDFSDILGSARIVGVEPYNDRLLVYTEHEAYEVLLDETQSPSTIDVTESVVEAHYFADRENVVMVTDGGNVIEYTDGNAQFADTVDVQWQNGVDVKTYSSRIYVLDPESNQIWKYQRGTSGYGSASAYVSDDTVDLSEALSFSIDGYIWILNEDGSITQLLSGENVPYALRQAPLAAVDGATKLYTELDINQLYLLDPTQSRVLIYNKSTSNEDLTYSSQYVLDGLKGTLQDLYFDKERDVIVMVTDFALYELGF